MQLAISRSGFTLARMAGSEKQSISALTRYCAVLGHPIAHSASPAMQNAGITMLGLDWCYVAYDVDPQELRKALDGAKAMRFIGLNLTVPHKLLAVDMMDVLDRSAKTWGAVNTVLFEARSKGRGWKSMREVKAGEVTAVRTRGFNTDADAIVRAISEDLRIRLSGAKVLLLGVGGAGRVAALKLAEAGASLHLVNRTEEKATALAVEIKRRRRGSQVNVGYPDRPVDLVVNATSLGLRRTDELPLNPKRFPLSKAGAVFDMIYQPPETPLLRLAKAAGCRTANGLSMLLHQGAAALEIWSGKRAPVAQMREALEAHVYAR